MQKEQSIKNNTKPSSSRYNDTFDIPKPKKDYGKILVDALRRHKPTK